MENNEAITKNFENSKAKGIEKVDMKTNDSEEIVEENIPEVVEETNNSIDIGLSEMQTPDENTLAFEINLSRYFGKNCPFCKTEIKEGDTIIVCPSCEAPHHEDCWQENKGCSTFGCSYQNSVKEIKKSFCSACGTELSENDKFCPKCGRQNEVITTNNQPTQVSSTINSNQPSVNSSGVPGGFTPNFEETQNIKNKKKKPAVVIAIVVVIVVVVGIFGYNSYQAKLEREYMSDCSEFKSAVFSSGTKLEDIGKEELSCWYDYIWDNGYYYKKYDSIEDAVSTAQSNESYNISQVKEKNSHIEDLYYSITSNPIAYSKKSNITAKVEDVYDDYKKMYDSILDPEGNYSTFKSTYNSCDSNLADSLEKLDDAL